MRSVSIYDFANAQVTNQGRLHDWLQINVATFILTLPVGCTTSADLSLTVSKLR